MHVCFHGGAVASGGGGGRIAKSIRDFTKILISRGSGSNARARRRQMRRCKDAAPAAMASASAKIAPAQLQEEEEAAQGGGREQGFCDKCCSSLMEAGGAEEEAAANMTEEGDREWVAEPEPGVLLTLAPRPDGTTNCLRRIRFREELFDAWAAQCWWADNHDSIAELYSLVQTDDDDDDDAVAAEAMLPATPCQSEEEDGGAGAESQSSRSPSTSTFSGGPSSGSGGGESAGTLGSPILGLITAPSTGAAAAAGADHDAIRDHHHQPTAAPWSEWVEEYEPGVFITVRAYPGHRLQLRCVELSREMFGEVKARVWWEENKGRLHHLYSF